MPATPAERSYRIATYLVLALPSKISRSLSISVSPNECIRSLHVPLVLSGDPSCRSGGSLSAEPVDARKVIPSPKGQQSTSPPGTLPATRYDSTVVLTHSFPEL